MSRRRCRPDRLSVEDPSFERQVQLALSLSLGVCGDRRAKRPREEEDAVVLPTKSFEATKYLGVERSNNLFRTVVKKARSRHVFGWYATATEAAVAYDELAVRVFGPDAQTNFAKRNENELPLYNAQLPATWKVRNGNEEKKWKAREATWYETLISEAVAAQATQKRTKAESSLEERRIVKEPLS